MGSPDVVDRSGLSGKPLTVGHVSQRKQEASVEPEGLDYSTCHQSAAEEQTERRQKYLRQEQERDDLALARSMQQREDDFQILERPATNPLKPFQLAAIAHVTKKSAKKARKSRPSP